MRVAEVLSDLTSLRACVSVWRCQSSYFLLLTSQNESAALALVSVRPSTTAKDKTTSNIDAQNSEDVDLKRAMDVIRLHYAVRATHSDGSVESTLLEARRSVRELGITG